jgi:hypothetical protein
MNADHVLSLSNTLSRFWMNWQMKAGRLVEYQGLWRYVVFVMCPNCSREFRWQSSMPTSSIPAVTASQKEQPSSSIQDAFCSIGKMSPTPWSSLMRSPSRTKMNSTTATLNFDWIQVATLIGESHWVVFGPSE